MFETEKRFSQEVSHCVWQWMLIRLTVATVSQWIGASAVAACGHVPRQDVWPAADRPRARRWSHRVTTGPEHFHRPVTSEPRNVTTPSAASVGCGWGRRGGPPGAGFCGADQRGRLELQQGGMAEDGAREKDHGRTRTPGSARRRAGRGPRRTPRAPSNVREHGPTTRRSSSTETFAMCYLLTSRAGVRRQADKPHF